MREAVTFQDFVGIDFGKGEIGYDNGDILHVTWPSGICLRVRSYACKPNYVILSKEGTSFQTFCCDTKLQTVSYVKNFARDINAGKYQHKKSNRERAFHTVQERNLTSYMNDTKWNRFLEIVRERLPFRPEYVYKLLSDSPDRGDIQPFRNIPRSQGCYCGECFAWYRFYEIEWVRITPKYAVNHGGWLSEKLEIFDETQELIHELEKAHIPFERDNRDIIIYGYR